MKTGSPKIVGCLIFPGFELLDVFGPLEMYGMYPENFQIQLISEALSPVSSNQGPRSVPDSKLRESCDLDILLVPGGMGTRTEINNQQMLVTLEEVARSATWITSVCTGSALLAAAGILDGCRATTNKNAFGWVSQFGENVDWVPIARWVRDGNIYTSSGVSAGMDMTLALIADQLGYPAAVQAADWAEYRWNEDSDSDPFAAKAGLVKRPGPKS